ncbi:MAG: TRAP transporter small permease [Microbacteriaceae bacterium]
MKFFGKYVTSTLGVISGFIVLILSLLTVADVTTRFITGRSVPGAIEYSEVLLVMCVFFAFGAAQMTNTHVSTSVLTSHLPKTFRKVLTYIVAAIVLALLVVMVVATIQQAIHSISVAEYRFGLVQVPLWPAKVAIAIGLVVYVIEFARGYFMNAERFEPETEEEMAESLGAGPQL